MAGQFPYFAAGIITSAVGAITSVVWAAQVPVAHPVAHPVPPAMAGQSTPYTPVARPVVPASNNTTNSPAQTPVSPGQAQVTPGFGAAQQVGTGGVPGTPSFPEGYATTGPFGQTGMNQPGQPPFIEGLYGNQGFQTEMAQPGTPSFYDGFGFNGGVVAPNQGATPTTPYPNSTTAPSSAPPSPNNGTSSGLGPSTGVVVTSPSVGFYNGFGGGQPDFGFYAGFTTPR
jgi:hypothetical protein